MGRRSYPIWLDIFNSGYATDKSHGVKNTESTVVNVGTSSKNSHRFLPRRHRAHGEEKSVLSRLLVPCVSVAILFSSDAFL